MAVRGNRNLLLLLGALLYVGSALRGEDFAVFENCLVVGNEAQGQGGGLFISSSNVEILNATITQNRAGGPGGGVAIQGSAAPLIANTILWQNNAAGDREVHPTSGGNAEITHSDIEQLGFAGNRGNISAYPIFAAPGNFHLRAGSPCIAAADPFRAPAADYDGVKRGLLADIGAFEHNGTARTFFVNVVTGSDTDNGLAATTSGNGTGPMKTIQAALNAAGPGDLVQVAAGVYKGTGNKDLDFRGKDLRLVSEAGPFATFILCENSGRGFKLHLAETPAALIQGFTVSGGNVVGQHPDGDGGAITVDNSSPTIRDCILADSIAEHGGGLELDNAGGRVENCLITGNRATEDGAGMYLVGRTSTLLLNCTVLNNFKSGVLQDVLNDALGLTKFTNGIAGAYEPSGLAKLPSNLFSLIGTERVLPSGNVALDGNAQLFIATLNASGNWNGAPTYNATTGRTTLMTSGNLWDSDALKGAFVSPGSSGNRWLLILSNTSNTLEVLGDAVASASGNAAFTIRDYHLHPEAGVIDNGDGTLAFGADLEDSARFDHPDAPNGPMAGTPPVDMGAYEFNSLANPLSARLRKLTLETDFGDEATYEVFDSADHPVPGVNGFIGSAGNAIHSMSMGVYTVHFTVSGNAFEKYFTFYEDRTIKLRGDEVVVDIPGGIDTFNRYEGSVAHDPFHQTAPATFFFYDEEVVTMANGNLSINDPHNFGRFPTNPRDGGMPLFDTWFLKKIEANGQLVSSPFSSGNLQVPSDLVFDFKLTYEGNAVVSLNGTGSGNSLDSALDTFERFEVDVTHQPFNRKESFIAGEGENVALSRGQATVSGNAHPLLDFPDYSFLSFSSNAFTANNALADAENRIPITANYKADATVTVAGTGSGNQFDSALDTYERFSVDVTHEPFHQTESVVVTESGNVEFPSEGVVRVNGVTSDLKFKNAFAGWTFKSFTPGQLFATNALANAENRIPVAATYAGNATVSLAGTGSGNEFDSALDTYQRYEAVVEHSPFHQLDTYFLVENEILTLGVGSGNILTPGPSGNTVRMLAPTPRTFPDWIFHGYSPNPIAATDLAANPDNLISILATYTGNAVITVAGTGSGNEFDSALDTFQRYFLDVAYEPFDKKDRFSVIENDHLDLASGSLIVTSDGGSSSLALQTFSGGWNRLGFKLKGTESSLPTLSLDASNFISDLENLIAISDIYRAEARIVLTTGGDVPSFASALDTRKRYHVRTEFRDEELVAGSAEFYAYELDELAYTAESVEVRDGGTPVNTVALPKATAWTITNYRTNSGGLVSAGNSLTFTAGDTFADPNTLELLVFRQHSIQGQSAAIVMLDELDTYKRFVYDLGVKGLTPDRKFSLADVNWQTRVETEAPYQFLENIIVRAKPGAGTPPAAPSLPEHPSVGQVVDLGGGVSGNVIYLGNLAADPLHPGSLTDHIPFGEPGTYTYRAYTRLSKPTAVGVPESVVFAPEEDVVKVDSTNTGAGGAQPLDTAPPPAALLTGAPGDGKARLSWSYPDPESGADAAEEVASATILYAPPATAETALVVAGNAHWREIANLKNGVTYSFRLKSRDAAGNENFSNTVSLAPTRAKVPLFEVADLEGRGGVDAAFIAWNYDAAAASGETIGFLIHRGTAAGHVLAAALPIEDGRSRYFYVDRDVAPNTAYTYTVTVLDKLNRRSAGLQKQVATVDARQLEDGLLLRRASLATDPPGFTHFPELFTGSELGAFPGLAEVARLPEGTTLGTESGNAQLLIPAGNSERQFYQTMLQENRVLSVQFRVRASGANPTNQGLTVLRIMTSDAGPVQEVEIFQDRLRVGARQARFYHGGRLHTYTLRFIEGALEIEADGRTLALESSGATPPQGDGNAFLRFGARSDNAAITAAFEQVDFLLGVPGFFPQAVPIADVAAPAVVAGLTTDTATVPGSVRASWTAGTEPDLAAYRLTVDGLPGFARWALGTDVAPLLEFPLPLPLPRRLRVVAFDHFGNGAEPGTAKDFQTLPGVPGTVKVYDSLSDFLNRGFRLETLNLSDGITASGNWLNFEGNALLRNVALTPASTWSLEIALAVRPDFIERGGRTIPIQPALEILELQTSSGNARLMLEPKRLVLTGAVQGEAPFAPGGDRHVLRLMRTSEDYHVFLDGQSFLSVNATATSLTGLVLGRLTGTGNFSLDRMVLASESTGGAEFSPLILPGEDPPVPEVVVSGGNSESQGLLLQWQTPPSGVSSVDVVYTTAKATGFTAVESQIHVLHTLPARYLSGNSFLPVSEYFKPKDGEPREVILEAVAYSTDARAGEGTGRSFSYAYSHTGNAEPNIDIGSTALPPGWTFTSGDGPGALSGNTVGLPSVSIPAFTVPLGSDPGLVTTVSGNQVISPDGFSDNVTLSGNFWSFSAFLELGSFKGTFFEATPVQGTALTLLYDGGNVLLGNQTFPLRSLTPGRLHHVGVVFRKGGNGTGTVELSLDFRLQNRNLDPGIPYTEIFDSPAYSGDFTVRFGNLAYATTAVASTQLKPTSWSEIRLSADPLDPGPGLGTSATLVSQSGTWTYFNTLALPVSEPAPRKTDTFGFTHLQGTASGNTFLRFGDGLGLTGTWTLELRARLESIELDAGGNVITAQQGEGALTVNGADGAVVLKPEVGTEMTRYRIVHTPEGITLFKAGLEVGPDTLIVATPRDSSKAFDLELRAAPGRALVFRDLILVDGAVDSATAGFQPRRGIFETRTAKLDQGVASDREGRLLFAESFLSVAGNALTWQFDVTDSGNVALARGSQVFHDYLPGSYGVTVTDASGFKVGLSNLNPGVLPRPLGTLGSPVLLTSVPSGNSLTLSWTAPPGESVDHYLVLLADPDLGPITTGTNGIVTPPQLTVAVPEEMRGRNLDLKVYAERTGDDGRLIRSSPLEAVVSTYDTHSVLIIPGAAPLADAETGDRSVNLLLDHQPDDLQGWVLWRNEPGQNPPGPLANPIKFIVQLGASAVPRLFKLSGNAQSFTHLQPFQRDGLQSTAASDLLDPSVSNAAAGFFFYHPTKGAFAVPIANVENVSGEYTLSLEPYDDALPHPSETLPHPNIGSRESGTGLVPLGNVNTLSVAARPVNASPEFSAARLSLSETPGGPLLPSLAQRVAALNPAIAPWIRNTADGSTLLIGASEAARPLYFSGIQAHDRTLTTVKLLASGSGAGRSALYSAAGTVDPEHEEDVTPPFVWNATDRRVELDLAGSFTPSTSLFEGFNTVEIEAGDLDGETSGLALEIATAGGNATGLVFDTSGPALSLETPKAGGVLTGRVVLSGTYTEASGVRSMRVFLNDVEHEVDGTEATVQNGSFWLPLSGVPAQGNVMLRLVAEDLAGNTSEVTRGFTFFNADLFASASVEVTPGGNVLLSATVNGAVDEPAGPKVEQVLLNGVALAPSSYTLVYAANPNRALLSGLDVTAGLHPGYNLLTLDFKVRIQQPVDRTLTLVASAIHYVNNEQPVLTAVIPPADEPLFFSGNARTLNAYSFSFFDLSPGVDTGNVQVFTGSGNGGFSEVTSSFDIFAGGGALKSGNSLTLLRTQPEVKVRLPEIGIAGNAVERLVRYRVLDATLQNQPHLISVAPALLAKGKAERVTLEGRNFASLSSVRLASEPEGAFALDLPVVEKVLGARVTAGGNVDRISVLVSPPLTGKAVFYLAGQPQKHLPIFIIEADEDQLKLISSTVVDLDGDGVITDRDLDANGDGVLDSSFAAILNPSPDRDGDHIPNRLDKDPDIFNTSFNAGADPDLNASSLGYASSGNRPIVLIDPAPDGSGVAAVGSNIADFMGTVPHDTTRVRLQHLSTGAEETASLEKSGLYTASTNSAKDVLIFRAKNLALLSGLNNLRILADLLDGTFLSLDFTVDVDVTPPVVTFDFQRSDGKVERILGYNSLYHGLSVVTGLRSDGLPASAPVLSHGNYVIGGHVTDNRKIKLKTFELRLDNAPVDKSVLEITQLSDKELSFVIKDNARINIRERWAGKDATRFLTLDQLVYGVHNLRVSASDDFGRSDTEVRVFDFFHGSKVKVDVQHSITRGDTPGNSLKSGNDAARAVEEALKHSYGIVKNGWMGDSINYDVNPVRLGELYHVNLELGQLDIFDYGFTGEELSISGNAKNYGPLKDDNGLDFLPGNRVQLFEVRSPQSEQPLFSKGDLGAFQSLAYGERPNMTASGPVALTLRGTIPTYEGGAIEQLHDSGYKIFRSTPVTPADLEFKYEESSSRTIDHGSTVETITTYRSGKYNVRATHNAAALPLVNGVIFNTAVDRFKIPAAAPVISNHINILLNEGAGQDGDTIREVSSGNVLKSVAGGGSSSSGGGGDSGGGGWDGSGGGDGGLTGPGGGTGLTPDELTRRTCTLFPGGLSLQVPGSGNMTLRISQGDLPPEHDTEGSETSGTGLTITAPLPVPPGSTGGATIVPFTVTANFPAIIGAPPATPLKNTNDPNNHELGYYYYNMRYCHTYGVTVEGIAVGQSRGGLKLDDAHFGFVPVSEATAEVVIDERQLLVVNPANPAEASTLSGNLLILDPLSSLAENPKDFPVRVLVNGREDLVTAVIFTSETGSWRATMEKVPLEFGTNRLAVTVINATGTRSRREQVIEIGDSDLRRDTLNDFFISSTFSTLETIEKQDLHTTRLFGEFTNDRGKVTASGAQPSSITLTRRKPKFGRFERPVFVVDNTPREGSIKPPETPFGSEAFVQNPGGSVELAYRAQKLQLYVEGVAFTQSGNKTHLLMTSAQPGTPAPFNLDAYVDAARPGPINFKLTILNESGTTTQLGAPSGNVAAVIEIAASGNVAHFDGKGRHFSTPTLNLVEILPNGSRYDAGTQKIVIKPGETVLAEFMTLKGRALVIPAVTDEYEAVTGVTPTMGRSLPLPWMTLSSEVLLHNRQLRFTNGLFSIPGRRLPMQAAFTYRSGHPGGAALGQGWVASWESYFTNSGNVYTFHQGNGRVDDFGTPSGNALAPPPGYAIKAETASDGQSVFFTHTDGSFTTYRAAPGRAILKLRQQEDRYGNKLRYDYGADDRLTSIVDDMDRAHRFFYEENQASGARLNKLKDALDLEYHFAYTGNGLLEKVEVFDQQDSGNVLTKVTYQYNTSDLLTGVVLGTEANPYATFAYDGPTALATAKYGNLSGNFLTESFARTGNKTTVTDANQVVAEYSFETGTGRKMLCEQVKVSPGDLNLTITRQYNGELRLQKETYPLGNFMSMAYFSVAPGSRDKRGTMNVTQTLQSADTRANPTGGVTGNNTEDLVSTASYHDASKFFQITSSLSIQGVTTQYFYGAPKESLVKTQTEAQGDIPGTPTDTVEMAYNTFGQLTHRLGVDGSLTFTEYYGSNFEHQNSKDLEGYPYRTSQSIDKGRTSLNTSVISPFDVNFLHSYTGCDRYGRAISFTAPKGGTTLTKYNLLGQKLEVRMPPQFENDERSRELEINEYDQRNLTVTTTHRNPVATATTTTPIYQYVDSVTTNAYDEVTRLLTSTNPVQGDNGFTQTIYEAGKERRKSERSAKNVYTHFLYDGAGRVTTTIRNDDFNPDNNLTLPTFAMVTAYNANSETIQESYAYGTEAGIQISGNAQSEKTYARDWQGRAAVETFTVSGGNSQKAWNNKGQHVTTENRDGVGALVVSEGYTYENGYLKETQDGIQGVPSFSNVNNKTGISSATDFVGDSFTEESDGAGRNERSSLAGHHVKRIFDKDSNVRKASFGGNAARLDATSGSPLEGAVEREHNLSNRVRTTKSPELAVGAQNSETAHAPSAIGPDGAKKDAGGYALKKVVDESGAAKADTEKTDVVGSADRTTEEFVDRPNRKRITFRAGQATEYLSDRMDRVTRINYFYNSSLTLEQVKNGTATITVFETFTYDSLFRLFEHRRKDESILRYIYFDRTGGVAANDRDQLKEIRFLTDESDGSPDTLRSFADYNRFGKPETLKEFYPDSSGAYHNGDYVLTTIIYVTSGTGFKQVKSDETAVFENGSELSDSRFKVENDYDASGRRTNLTYPATTSGGTADRRLAFTYENSRYLKKAEKQKKSGASWVDDVAIVDFDRDQDFKVPTQTVQYGQVTTSRTYKSARAGLVDSIDFNGSKVANFKYDLRGLKSDTGQWMASAGQTNRSYQHDGARRMRVATAGSAGGIADKFGSDDNDLDDFENNTTLTDIDGDPVSYSPKTGLERNQYASYTDNNGVSLRTGAPSISALKMQITQINFQPTGSTLPTGHLKEDGTAYALRSGYTYGWTQSGNAFTNSGNTFERFTSADDRHDTGMNFDSGNAIKWEMAVAPGTYFVDIVAGDPNTVNRTIPFSIYAEGNAVVTKKPDIVLAGSGNVWAEGMINVVVTDGKLTIESKQTGPAVDQINYVVVVAKENLVLITGSPASGTVIKPAQPQTTGTFPMSYNDRGDTTEDNQFKYKYDPFDRNTEVEDKFVDDTMPINVVPKKVHYLYDAMGRRILRRYEGQNGAFREWGNERTVYDGLVALEEREEATGICKNRYYYGDSINAVAAVEKNTDMAGDIDDAGDEVAVPIVDDRGTVAGVADKTGTLKEKVYYNSSGLAQSFNPDGSTPQKDAFDENLRTVAGLRFGYTGMFKEPMTGKYKTHFRDYDAVHRRWMTEDPAMYKDSQNLYVFCGMKMVDGEDLYGAESKEEWQKLVAKDAGISLDDWKPGEGFKFNQDTIIKVYEWYAKIFQEHSDQLYWAGMAKVAGGAVYGGLEAMHNIPAALSKMGPKFDIPEAGKKNISNTMKILLEMNKDIFLDLAWQHMAYITKHIDEMEERHKYGDLDDKNFQAWKLIDAKSQDERWAGNEMLLHREQKKVVQENYDRLATIEGAARAMSFIIQSPLPNGMPFREYSPNGDITKFDDRWSWIEKDMLPKWRGMSDKMRIHLTNRSLHELGRRDFGGNGE